MGYFTWLWQDRQLRQLKDLNAQVASAVADLPDSGVTDQEWALLTALQDLTDEVRILAAEVSDLRDHSNEAVHGLGNRVLGSPARASAATIARVVRLSS